MLSVTVLSVLLPASLPITWITPSPIGTAAPAAYMSTSLAAFDVPEDFERSISDSASPVSSSDRGNSNELSSLALERYASRQRLFEQLERFEHLKSDWAGLDARPISSDTVSLAQALIEGIPLSCPLPQVSPSADGEVGFSWVMPEKIVEAILDREAVLVWFSTFGGQVHPGGEDLCNGSFPDKMFTELGIDVL